MCFVFYANLVLETSSPSIQTNIYDSVLETSINFMDDDVQWAFAAWRTDTMRMLTYEEFEENFSLYVTKMEWVDLGTDGAIPILIPIPVIPCSNVKKDYDV